MKIKLFYKICIKNVKFIELINKIIYTKSIIKGWKMEEKNILNEIKKDIVKEKTISLLAKKYDITEFEVLGFIKKLKDDGINISYSEKNKEAYVVINDHPDYTKENEYFIKENVDEITKIAFISDTRFGCKNEQIGILNDMYKNFAINGIKYVFILGNLLEGPYKGEENLEYGKSLITGDAYGQADHLIEYYPKVEGIKTYFITGKNDHKFAKELNIGEYISKEREDLIYLGPRACTVHFNDVSFKLEQLKAGNAYTVAYPAQTYSRSMSSYEDYDAIFLSGTRSMQHFPSIRDTQIFAIPSVVERTAKMKASREQNTIGALLISLSYTKNGKLKRMIPEMMPYYKPSKESFLTTKKLNITKNELGKYENIDNLNKNKHAYFDSVDKIYRLLKKEQSFAELKNKLEISDNELYGIIDILNEYGRPIEVVNEDGILVIKKTIQKRKEVSFKLPKEELHKKEILVVSDTHYGSIWCQPSMVNTACYEAYNRGITDFYHIGDISDGDYSRVRPNHIREVFLYGATGQINYVIENLPKYPGCTWHAIQGSHDQTHEFNYGVVLADEVAKKRKDFEYLGQDRAFTYFDNCKVELFHPGGGTSRILSTKPQNGIDQLPSGTKPNLSIRGHYHKIYYMLYRNIHMLLAPCNVDQSSFMMKNELPNLMGDYFLTIYYNDNGDIEYLDVEPMIFSQKDVRKYDFENPKKCIKSKILTKKEF